MELNSDNLDDLDLRPAPSKYGTPLDQPDHMRARMLARQQELKPVEPPKPEA